MTQEWKVLESTDKDGNKTVGTALELSRLLPTFTWHSAWSSPEQFTKRIRSLDPKKAWEDDGWSSGKRFTGTDTMEEALQLGELAWPEGAKMVSDMRDKILARWPLRKKAVKFGIVGSVPDVVRAIAGDPNNMKDIGSALSRKRPVITLVSDMCASCWNEADHISNRAAVIAAIVDQIETSGYACEVIAVCVSNGNRERRFRANVSVILKEAGVSVDTGRLAFGLGHASMFRRFVFAEWGSSKECENGLGSGLGHVVGLSKEEQKEMASNGLFYVQSLQGNSERFKTAQVAIDEGVEWQVNQLRKLGCPAFPAWTQEDENAEKEKELAKRIDI